VAVAHFNQDYPVLVDNLLQQMSEDDAMARAVGAPPGTFMRYAHKERLILEQYGFEPSDAIVDIGCGAGRLAAALSDTHRGIYAGFDIVDKLVEYADRRFGGDNFHFFTCDGLDIPLDGRTADFMTFFSVFTHLHHEETFIYLQEAMRVLRPGGTLVCSYLDFEENWPVFEATVAARHNGTQVHANVFMNADIIRRLVEGAGFDVVAVHPPHTPFIQVPQLIEIRGEESLPAGPSAMGQGICVARTPS